MRFTVDHAALAPALATVTRVVQARPARPVLSAVLLEAGEGYLRATATDLETAISATVPAAVEEDGRAALPARYLNEMMRRIPGGTLTWSTEAGTAGAHIRWGKTQLTIHGYEPNDYPTAASFPDHPDRTIAQGLLRHAITHTAFAAAQGETARALLTGVELRFAGDALFALATDGFQAAAYETQPGSPRPTEGAIVVPASVLVEVARLLADPDQPCDIAQQGNQILFRAGSVHLAARLLEGKYFAVLDLVPKAFPTTIRVARTALIGACERVGLICEADPPHAVTLDVAAEQLTLTATHADVGTAEETLEGAIDGPPLRLGFNVRQMTEGLRRFEGGEILLEISGITSLARFTDPTDRRLNYLQMPLQMPE